MVKAALSKDEIGISELSSQDLLSYVEKTKDRSAFKLLFERLEAQVRDEIYRMGTDVRTARRIQSS